LIRLYPDFGAALFPAGAGVILKTGLIPHPAGAVPRRGGGDPTTPRWRRTGPYCSPQGRG